jgi:hypothetical protein
MSLSLPSFADKSYDASEIFIDEQSIIRREIGWKLIEICKGKGRKSVKNDENE